MARKNFENCLTLVLHHEGGYVDHPKDPGGRTNKGVIQRTYDTFRDRRGLPRQSVRHIGDSEVRDIYRSMYWWPVKGDELPAGIDYTVFDASVNSGVARGPKWTQRALGVAADGIVGQKTLAAAVNLSVEEMVEAIKKAAAYRMGFLKGLSHWSTFGRGWSRRVAEVEAGSIAMVTGTHRLHEEAAKSKKAARDEAAGGVTTGLAGAGSSVVEMPDIVNYAIYGLVALLVIVILKRALAHFDRAAMMEQVAETLEKLEH